MNESFGFRTLVQNIEQRLVGALDLRPRVLPPELARLAGVFREKPVVLEARAYSGPALGYARFVELHGEELEIGNILVWSRPELALPVLGVDLVGLGRDTAVVVADLSPVTADETERERQLAVLQRHRRAQPRLDSDGALPAWANEWFSRGALCTRIGRERAADAAPAVDEFVAAFGELLELAARREPRDTADITSHGRSPEAARDVAARIERYCAAHREQDRGLLLLRRIFQPEHADRFLSEVLFPERLPS